MPAYFENLNMEYFIESEDAYTSLMQLVASEGKGIWGYYKLPYINKHFGNAQVILRTQMREQSAEINGLQIQAVDMDTHTSGRRVWEVRVHEMNIDKKEHGPLEKRVVVTRMDGGGMAVVNIVNADVLPSYMKDDVIKMQMVAFPDIVEYFKDYADYAAHQPNGNDGHKWLIGEGSVFPTGMLRNRDPESSEFESNERLDNLTAIRGTVQKLYWGKIEFDGEEHDAFLKCIVDTAFGELEIVHTVDQVAKELRPNMKIGSTVVMYGTLSGDVAIYEYDKGMIRDEDHNLAAMRYMFTGSDPEHIRSILAKDVVYLAQSGKKYEGADAVINQFKYVQKENPDKYFAHFARISEIKEGAELEYPVDTRCLILASGEETAYESIAFFDYDAEGYISRIVTTTNPNYRFIIQHPVFNTDEVEEASD